MSRERARGFTMTRDAPITRERRRARSAVHCLLAGLAERHRELATVDAQCGAWHRGLVHAETARVLDELARSVLGAPSGLRSAA